MRLRLLWFADFHYAHQKNNNRKTRLKRDAQLWGRMSERHTLPPPPAPAISAPTAETSVCTLARHFLNETEIYAKPVWQWSEGCGQWPNQASSPAGEEPWSGNREWCWAPWLSTSFGPLTDTGSRRDHPMPLVWSPLEVRFSASGVFLITYL